MRPTDPSLRLPSTGSRPRCSARNHSVYTTAATIPHLYNQNPKAFAAFEQPQLNLASTPPPMADHFLKLMESISPGVWGVIIPACLREGSAPAPPALHTRTGRRAHALHGRLHRTLLGWFLHPLWWYPAATALLRDWHFPGCTSIPQASEVRSHQRDCCQKCAQIHPNAEKQEVTQSGVTTSQQKHPSSKSEPYAESLNTFSADGVVLF